jgi:hypothetical protein
MGMNSLLISTASHRRLARALAWLEARAPAEEVLIIGATLDAANELARRVVQARGAAFGWHRLTLAQLAAVLAASAPRACRILPLGQLGVQAICARVVHRLANKGGLGRYSSIANGPGFARALRIELHVVCFQEPVEAALNEWFPNNFLFEADKAIPVKLDAIYARAVHLSTSEHSSRCRRRSRT